MGLGASKTRAVDNTNYTSEVFLIVCILFVAYVAPELATMHGPRSAIACTMAGLVAARVTRPSLLWPDYLAIVTAVGCTGYTAIKNA